MTSLDYDDSIEIISYHAEREPGGAEHAYVSFSSVRRDRRGRTAGDHLHPDLPPFSKTRTALIVTEAAVAGVVAGRTVSRPTGHVKVITDPCVSPQYRRMKCAIISMAAVMLIACIILVGVSLSMAEHIDELGKKNLLHYFK